jgi:hypothetical protein
MEAKIKPTHTGYTHDHTNNVPDPLPDITRQVPPIPTDCAEEQCPLDIVELSSMESFPCSDPPCYTTTHA